MMMWLRDWAAATLYVPVPGTVPDVPQNPTNGGSGGEEGFSTLLFFHTNKTSNNTGRIYFFF